MQQFIVKLVFDNEENILGGLSQNHEVWNAVRDPLRGLRPRMYQVILRSSLPCPKGIPKYAV